MIQYPHTIRFVESSVDGYGAPISESVADVRAVFEQGTQFNHGNYQDAIGSDAVAVVDPNNSFIIDNAYRLEEFLIIANPYDAPEYQQWFKVVSSRVGSTHQLCNDIDNVQIALKKTRGVVYVS